MRFKVFFNCVYSLPKQQYAVLYATSSIRCATHPFTPTLGTLQLVQYMCDCPYANKANPTTPTMCKCLLHQCATTCISFTPRHTLCSAEQAREDYLWHGHRLRCIDSIERSGGAVIPVGRPGLGVKGWARCSPFNWTARQSVLSHTR